MAAFGHEGLGAEAVQLGEPLRHIRKHRLDQDAPACPAHPHPISFEPELTRQAYGLTTPIHEQLCNCGHDRHQQTDRFRAEVSAAESPPQLIEVDQLVIDDALGVAENGCVATRGGCGEGRAARPAAGVEGAKGRYQTGSCFGEFSQ